MISVVTSDRKRWIDTMIQEEYGLILEGASPWRAAAVTFSAFVLLGALPLIPFVWLFLSPDSGDGALLPVFSCYRRRILPGRGRQGALRVPALVLGRG
jgi:VIT family